MLKSMTAFAQRLYQDNQVHFYLEIRSVNHRYLEMNVRLPEGFRELEGRLRDLIKASVQRGKVEVNLRYFPGMESMSTIHINQGLIQSLQQAIIKTQQVIPQSTVTNVVDILRWPGVLCIEEAQTECLKDKVVELFEQMLKEFNFSRSREGEKICHILREKLMLIKNQIQLVKDEISTILELQREKLLRWMKQAMVELDSNRLEQEMLLYTQKLDVTEELDRLSIHVAETESLLEKGGAIGRNLDFLFQEFHREANTLGSKSVSATTSRASVELKILIEQMREQVQNVE